LKKSPAKTRDEQYQLGKNEELGQIYALYQKALTIRGRYDFEDMINFVVEAFSRDENQKPVAIINPPSQIPVIKSSTPSHLDKPTPAPTATTQTGQTASALTPVARNSKSTDRISKNLLSFTLFCCKPTAAKIIDPKSIGFCCLPRDDVT